jgi:hypothetical protein
VIRWKVSILGKQETTLFALNNSHIKIPLRTENLTENNEDKMMSIVNGLQRISHLGLPKMQYSSHYHEHGFMVKFKAIPENLILAANIASMKDNFLASNNHIVFNAKDISQITAADAERRQLVTKHYEEVARSGFTKAQKNLLKRCEEIVTSIVANLLRDIDKFKTIESLLYSRDGSKERQKLHVDLADELKEIAALALVCLEPNTTFIMCRGSHKESLEPEVNNYPRIYGLSVGDVLIFHPNLIHAGDRYSKSNLRLHYYVIAEAAEYELNLTYPVEIDIRDKVDVMMANVKHHENMNDCYGLALEKKKKTKVKRQNAMLENRKKRKYESNESIV